MYVLTDTHTHTHTLIMTLYLCLSVLQVLLKWINDVLEERRIRVRDIVEDLYDGQVLSELMGRTPTCEGDGLLLYSIPRATDWKEVYNSWCDTVCRPAANKTEDTSRQG